MKSLKTLFYLLFFVLTLPILASAQKNSTSGPLNYGDRGVIWVHGYQGSVGSWQVYQGYVNKKYKAQSLPISYNSNLGFTSAAQQILNLELPTPQESQPPHLIVAHSFGGLTTRALVAKAPNLTNAYITVGTPHAGSKGMDMVSIQNLINKLVNLIDPIVKHPLVSAVNNILPRWMLKSFHTFIREFDDYKGQINTTIGAYTGSWTSGQIAQGNKDLANLGFGGANIQKIAVAGVEDFPEHLRWMSSWQWSPSDHALDLTDDNGLINKYQSIKGKLSTFKNILKFISQFNPILSALSNDLLVKVDKAINYIDNQFYNDWMDTIGAAVTTNGTCTKWILDPNSEANKPKVIQVTYPCVTTTIAPNDGILVESSARALQGACRLESAAGANHQEELNHPSMTKLFDDIFLGKDCSGKFKLELR